MMSSLLAHGRSILLVLLALAVLLPGAAVAQSQNDDPRPTSPERELLDHLGDARVYRDDATGNVNLIGTTRQDAIGRPTGLPANASPVAAARAHLSEYGALFGLGDPAQELRAEETDRVGQGRSVVHFQQVHDGVPVLGGELNVQLTDANELLVANGEVLSGAAVGKDPQLTADAARENALAKIARDRNMRAADLDATDPELWVYDPALLGAPGPQITQLVWRMEVSPNGLDHFRELVLVEANRGAVVLNFNQVHAALDREIYTANNDPTTTFPGTLVCDGEDDTACPEEDADAVNVHRYSKDTYDFYLDIHGRDSIDGAGMTIKSTVDICPPGYPCPLPNAAWLGAQKHAVYGDGITSDDVVGHEFTHGVTDHESNLFYYYQSGAINESLSDIWGEFIDLTNGSGTDTDAVRWQGGEDVPGGARRDAKDPTTYGDPDRMQSSLYWGSESDSGGVHHNSGVNNKAAYLMTDGDTFNGKTVTGLGIQKVAKIYYEVQTNLLTSASDHKDLYAALQQACTNLTGTSGITASDCQEVKDAVDATEMNLQPLKAAAPEAPVCLTGQTASDLFSDDLENPQSGNWVSGSLVGDDYWYYPQDPGMDYATSGITNLWGWNQDAVGDYFIATTNGVAPPADKSTYLRFNHAYGFDDDVDRPFTAYDGGVLEYSTDDGSTWKGAGSLITHNGYNGAISDKFDNPLGGRKGFVRQSNGYTSSRVDLSSLAGQSVRFRFRIGTDSGYEDYGWFIDDVRVYTCEGAANDTTPPTVKSHTPTRTLNVSPNANVTATFSEEMKAGTINKDTVKLVRKGSTTRVGASLSYDANSRKVVLDPRRTLKAGATYKATVTTGAEDLAGNSLDQTPTLTGNQMKVWRFKIKP
ncbi:MAG: Bacillolysin precursor (Neutral protease) [uncultured Rubrobacteraceae bacterium]|uniref:Bacillolysin (Neutral protease) n=1 Tax=uncultured Rubrobacteraceae bacterium TaxID=349277 RepID=A0A6J4NCT8_9ACTN|nr:MAG: Bacillolysin precursor (Neutral protease) [uncultured Rubrobacteraceae bacterium]